jgi:hypothetical protein
VSSSLDESKDSATTKSENPATDSGFSRFSAWFNEINSKAFIKVVYKGIIRQQKI